MNDPIYIPTFANTLEKQKIPTLTHIPLTNPGAYYRSKILTTTVGINPLIAASNVLFILIANLRTTPSLLEGRELYLHLVHEIKAFETQAQTFGYRAETILLARYILCAMLDETILNACWEKQSDWQRYKLLTTFHNEDWGGERFFLILDRLSIDPASHIDLLELTYLCLSLGFVGKYHGIPNKKVELEEITEKLYQCIRWQRGNIKKELALNTTTVGTPKKATSPTSQPLPLWLLGILTLLLMFTVYIGFNFILNNHIATFYQQFNTILQPHADD